MTNTSNSRYDIETRKLIARKHQAEAVERGPKAQLARLDERLGEGVGAKRERAKLNRQLSGKGKAGTKKKTK